MHRRQGTVLRHLKGRLVLPLRTLPSQEDRQASRDWDGILCDGQCLLQVNQLEMA